VSHQSPSRITLRDRFPELGEMRERYSEAFVGNRRAEGKTYLLIAAIISLYGFGLYYVGFSP